MSIGGRWTRWISARIVTVGAVPIVLAIAVSGGAVLAQESPNFTLTEHTFNAGGSTPGGTMLASPNYQITFGSLGDAAAVNFVLNSPSFQMDGGFVASFPPADEVAGLRFTDGQTLVWNPEPSARTYQLYRDLLSALSSLTYGDCEQQNLGEETTIDPEIPPGGEGYFYLLTVRNHLEEEGTKGTDSDGEERPNPVACP